jgi:hypothetical protein
MAPMLFHGLAALGLPVICIESRQAYQALKSLATHKTDRNDARGLAHLARTGFFKPVHMKSLPAHAVRALIIARKKLIGQRVTLQPNECTVCSCNGRGPTHRRYLDYPIDSGKLCPAQILIPLSASLPASGRAEQPRAMRHGPHGGRRPGIRPCSGQRIDLPKLQGPPTDSLVGDEDATLQERLPNQPQAQWEPKNRAIPRGR